MAVRAAVLLHATPLPRTVNFVRVSVDRYVGGPPAGRPADAMEVLRYGTDLCELKQRGGYIIYVHTYHLHM